MRLPSERKTSGRRRRILYLGLSGYLSLCWMWQGCSSGTTSAKRGDGVGGVPVTVKGVVRKDVPVDIRAVGNVEAYLTVTVKAQVSGELTRVYFQEGDYVRKGGLLFTIDPRLVQAQLDQAEANLARDEAESAQMEAMLSRDVAQQKYAQAQSARYDDLLERGLVSKEQAEQFRTSAEAASATVRADEASVRSARAAVAAGKAAVENYRVQLGYTSIRSPVDGRTGNLNVKQGNVVTANATDLMTINQVQPIYATFSVPEGRRPEIKKSQLVMASAQNDSSAPEMGELTFIDNAVDPTTGTLRLKGTFRNQNRTLWPGEFVRVTLRLGIQSNALVVPNQAVQTGQDGAYVYVVKPDRTVESRPVVTGARLDQDLVVEKGLQVGETVVVEGQLRLAPGSHVQIQGDSESAPGSRARREGGSK